MITAREVAEEILRAGEKSDVLADFVMIAAASLVAASAGDRLGEMTPEEKLASSSYVLTELTNAVTRQANKREAGVGDGMSFSDFRKAMGL